MSTLQSISKEFVITRTFDAPIDLVWQVHTEAEHLAKWWGPVGLKMIHCSLDLRPGGMFHYGMETPDGQQMWGKFVYREVEKPKKLVFVVSFSDKDAGITRHPLAPNWPLEVMNIMTLTENNGKTTLTLSGGPINCSEDERNTFEANFTGMNNGFKGTYDQLEAYLITLKK